MGGGTVSSTAEFIPISQWALANWAASSGSSTEASTVKPLERE